MTIPSNLYAEKIFSEHPLEMWTLDDETSYLSWIDEPARNLSTWTKTSTGGASASIYTYGVGNSFDQSQYEQASVKFINSFQQQLHFDSVSSNGTITLTSNALSFNSSQIDPVSGCISLGVMAFTNDESITGIRIGYKINSPTPQVVMQDVKNLRYESWANLLETIPIQPTATAYDVKMIIEVSVKNSSGNAVDIFFNGIVVGQGAEYFSNSSLGIKYSTIPNDIWLPAAVEQREGIEVRPYGLSDEKGYYIIHNDFELVSQSGIPMVYGSNVSTVLNPISSDHNCPNLIVPAKGFLNDLGRYKSLSLEFWIKINHNGQSDTTPYRIVGPTTGSDGLYIDESFLILKIGDKHSSYFVGEWSRPMLIQICVSQNLATIILNGVSVITMAIDSANVAFTPHTYDSKDQDWIGFYSPSEIVDTIELDCIAIYPYVVSEILAKRRFSAYGQGVAFPRELNSAYGGTSVYVDFSKSGYSKNIIFPENHNWTNGQSDNIVVTNKAGLSLPNYSMPNFIHESQTLSKWLDENKTVSLASGRSYPTFTINPFLDDTNPFLKILNLSNFSGKNLETIGCIINPGSEVAGEAAGSSRSVFTLYNESSRDYLRLSIKNVDGLQKLVYSVKIDGTEYDIYAVDAGTNSEKICASLNITQIVSYINSLASDIYDNEISISASSFLNLSQTTLYIGADPDNKNTFNGEFVKFFIMNLSNFNDQIQKSQVFENGMTDGFLNIDQTDSDNVDAINALRATYEIKPLFHGPNGYILDIACSGYWYDYVPLSLLSKKVYTDSAETQMQEDLDFIQFNIGYPENINSDIFKTYINFEYATLFSANVGSHRYYSIVSSADNVFEPGVASKWSGKKYEVSDGSIVYAPVDEQSQKPQGAPDVFNINDIFMVITTEFNVDSISYQPLSIKSMQLSGVSLNHNSKNNVNTRYGINIRPEVEIDSVISYKERNPYRISTVLGEYLNLTSKSGIELAKDNDAQRRLVIDINRNNSASYRISSMQFAFNHRGYFSETKELAFRMFSQSVSGKEIMFYLKSVNASNTRGILTAEIDGVEIQGIKFYINGTEVRSPIFKRGEWGMLGISFSPALDYSGTSGRFEIYSKILVNNLSYYQISEEVINQYQVFKTWSTIDNNDWDYWKTNDTWQTLLRSSDSLEVSIDASDVYRIFMGTNKVISDSKSDDLAITFTNYQYSIYNNVSKQSRIQKPL
jgi:hypothetical protein